MTPNYKLIKGYSKDELTSLLKETRKMSKMVDPANHVKTSNMCDLFESAFEDSWLGKFQNVSQLIEREILYRIINNNW